MNCQLCQQWLQRHLDGEAGEPDAVVATHLAQCPECRSYDEAARRLRHGLLLLTPPLPPPGLADRVSAAALADRRRRLVARRRLAGVLALAAALLKAVFVGAFGRKEPAPSGVAGVVSPRAEPPSLRKTVAQAGDAVAGLTARTVDQAVVSTRNLLPLVDGNLLAPWDLPQPLDPPARSLAQAGQNLTAGLEPVARSARRALNLFLRDLPLPAAGKPQL